MTLFRHLTTDFTRSGVLAGAAAAVLLWSAVPAAAHSDQQLADLVEETAPSVVTILASSTSTAALNQGMERNGKSPFEEFFRQFGAPEEFQGNPERFGREGPRQGLGSGFIFDEDGLIVTNHHVVVDADKVTVRLSDRREFEAEVIGMDKQTDLAVLRIDVEETLQRLLAQDPTDCLDGEVGVEVLRLLPQRDRRGPSARGIGEGERAERGECQEEDQATEGAAGDGCHGGPPWGP